MVRFEVTINDERYPELHLTIHTAGQAVTERASYDIAETKFEPHVRNILHQAVQTIIQRRKRLV